MRKIKFRGQKSDAGKQWVYGWLIQDEEDGKYYIAKYYGIIHESHEVIPETIGQLLGEDKNGNDVYEDDILKSENGSYKIIWTVGAETLIGFNKKEGKFITSFAIEYNYERVGSIHEEEWADKY
jgi:hypothetical protein